MQDRKFISYVTSEMNQQRKSVILANMFNRTLLQSNTIILEF